MPLFDFRCLACGKQFELLVFCEQDELEAECPQCHAKQAQKLVSKVSRAGSSSGSSCNTNYFGGG